jgi:hypothetical protein
MRIKMIQSSRRKDKTKVGLSTTTSSLADNTRKSRIQTQLSGNNTIPKSLRMTPTAVRIRSRPQIGKKYIAHAAEGRSQGATSGTRPSQTVMNPMQEKDTRKKRKYDIEDLFLFFLTIPLFPNRLLRNLHPKLILTNA